MNKKVFYKIIVHGVLIAFSVLAVLPFTWMILASFKPIPEILAQNQTFFPIKWTIENYQKVFKTGVFMRYFMNSLWIVAVVTVISSYTSTLAGYVLGKYRFRSKKFVFGLVMATMMLPWCVTIIPRYTMIKQLGWINNYAAIIVPAIFSGFGIFMMKQNMETIPNEIIEAARVDGCSEFYIFHRIIIPMSKNGIFSIAIFQFLWVWEDYLWPYLVIQKPDMQLVSVGLKLFNGQYMQDYGAIFAATMISIIPVVVVYLLLQKRFVEGIANSGLKG